MSVESAPGQSAAPCKDQPAGRELDTREGARSYDSEYRLRNSRIRFEPGVTGVIARIIRRDGVEYVGPFDDPAAVERAVAEVAWHG